MEGKLACNPDSKSFFVSLPIQPKHWFSGVLEGRFYLKSGPSNVSPHCVSCVSMIR